MKTLKTLILLFALAFAAAVSGQAGPRTGAVAIDIRAEYDIWPSDVHLKVSSIYTPTTARAKHPDLWRSLAMLKLTEAQALDMTLFEAAMWDANLRNSDFIADGNYPLHGGLLIDRNDIKIPNGYYEVTRPLEYAFGQWEGSGGGTGNGAYAGRGGDTEIAPWLEQWKGDPKHVVVIRAFHHGSNSFTAYSEGRQLRNLRVNGRAGKWYDPARTITGIQLWDDGETSGASDLFVHQCDTGINIIRGTPFNCSGMLSLFSNNCAGLVFTGGGTANIDVLSMDDNAVAVLSVAGYGRVASMGMNAGAVKSEWYVTDATWGRTPKMNTWVLNGWIHLNIGYFSHAIGPAYQDALFIVKPDVNTSHIRVNDIRLFAGSQLGVLLRDRVAKKAWGFDTGWSSTIQEFRWTSTGGSLLESWPTQAPPVLYTYTGGQLGYLKGDPTTGAQVGSFDRVNGLPTWSDVTGSSTAPVAPPVTPPTPTPIPPTTTPVLSWATTFSGTGPNLIATKGVSIAPSSYDNRGTFASGVITTNAGTKYPWADGKAARIVLLGVTLKAAPAYQHLTANHVVYPDGRVMYRTVYNNPGGDVDTGLKLAQGVKVTSLSLPCPGGILNTLIGSPVGAGNGAPLTIEALEVWK